MTSKKSFKKQQVDNLITSKQILYFLEDGGVVGNVSNWNYLSKDAIINKLNNSPEFVERVLVKLFDTDYSYFISAQFNPLFVGAFNTLKSGKHLDNDTLNRVRSTLIDNYIFILVEIVNYYSIL
jgi:hypothetical protein